VYRGLVAFQELHTVRYLGQDLVFLRAGQPIHSIKTAFETAKGRAGITNFRFHNLRHYAVTNLRRAGVDDATTMAIIGHQSPQMWKRYNTIDASELKPAAAKVNTLIILAAEQSAAVSANQSIS